MSTSFRIRSDFHGSSRISFARDAAAKGSATLDATPKRARPLGNLSTQELNTLGYVEGKNLVIDKRAAETKFDRLPALVNELVHPNVIVAVATPAIAAAQRATSTIPIIMLPVTDPVRLGFVKSLAHPGGN